MTLRDGLFVLAWCSLAVIGTACGDDDDDAMMPIEQVPDALAATVCADLEPCLGPLADMFLNGADCETSFAASLTDQDLPRWQAAIDAGTVVYHGDKVQACIDAFGGIGCEFGSRRPPAICEEALQGTIALGGECNAGVECEGDAYCKFDNECPGTCAALESEGSSCEESDQCEDGLACLNEHCTAPAQEGETCQGPDGPDCQGGLVCAGANRQERTAGTCQPFDEVLVGQEGDTCNLLELGPLCAEGLSCILDALDLGPPPVPTFVCAQGVASGEACKLGFPDPCPDGEHCTADPFQGQLEGQCESLPDAGEPCLLSPFGVSCAPGLACVGTTCTQMGRTGEPCTSDGGCYSGACDGDTCTEAAFCEYGAN